MAIRMGFGKCCVRNATCVPSSVSDLCGNKDIFVNIHKLSLHKICLCKAEKTRLVQFNYQGSSGRALSGQDREKKCCVIVKTH